MRNGLHGDFDRGYFSAWADCMRVLARQEMATSHVNKSDAVSEKETLETLKSDKSQATIENFLKKKLDDAEEKD